MLRHVAPDDERRYWPPQGEALAVWAIWGLVLLAIVVTYSRLPPEETYNVSREGIVGGLSRVVVELNFPIALVAIGITLVALSALPAAAWWAGGPAIALCAVTAWPGVVDQSDLDARWVNAVPAAGVAIAVGLTAVAARRSGRRFTPRRGLDRARIVLAAVTLVVSIPWIAAILGFYLPEGIFIMERPGIEDGETIARSEERRVGKECCLVCRSRWSPSPCTGCSRSRDRKSTRLNSSHCLVSRMPSSA